MKHSILDENMACGPSFLSYQIRQDDTSSCWIASPGAACEAAPAMGPGVKIVEMYNRKYVICNEFQDDAGHYLREIANCYPEHPNFIERKGLDGRIHKYTFVRHAKLEVGKEIVL